MEKQSEDIDSAFEAKDYRKALFHIEQSLNIALASKRLKVKKAECLAYLGKLTHCEHFMILLPLRFYVKLSLDILEVQNLPFQHI